MVLFLWCCTNCFYKIWKIKKTSSYTELGDAMKKFFEALGMIALICFSFFYTEKTANVVKELDDIMIEIKKNKDSYQVSPIDATIVEDTIIPGLCGKVVDENKSYTKMKRYGSYHPPLLEYKEVLPKISFQKHYDKYIIAGNKEKKMVSLLFLVEENSDIESILKILETKEAKATFFVDGRYLEKNNDMLFTLIQNGHDVGNKSYQMDYTNSAFVWMDTMIKKVGKQDTGFCLNKEPDSEGLKLCALNHNYTVRPMFVNNNPLMTIKEHVSAGSLFALPINATTIKELSSIITYITSRGYTLSPLQTHLKE